MGFENTSQINKIQQSHLGATHISTMAPPPPNQALTQLGQTGKTPQDALDAQKLLLDQAKADFAAGKITQDEYVEQVTLIKESARGIGATGAAARKQQAQKRLIDSLKAPQPSQPSWWDKVKSALSAGAKGGKTAISAGTGAAVSLLSKNPQILEQLKQFSNISPTPPETYGKQPEIRYYVVNPALRGGLRLFKNPIDGSSQLILPPIPKDAAISAYRLNAIRDYVFVDWSVMGVSVRGYAKLFNADGTANLIDVNRSSIPEIYKKSAPAVLPILLAGGGAYLLWVFLQQKKGGQLALGRANLGRMHSGRPRRRSRMRTGTSSNPRRSRSGSTPRRVAGSTRISSPRRRSRAGQMTHSPRRRTMQRSLSAAHTSARPQRTRPRKPRLTRSA